MKDKIIEGKFGNISEELQTLRYRISSLEDKVKIYVRPVAEHIVSGKDISVGSFIVHDIDDDSSIYSPKKFITLKHVVKALCDYLGLEIEYREKKEELILRKKEGNSEGEQRDN